MTDALQYIRNTEFQEDLVEALTQAFKDKPDQLEHITGLTTGGGHVWKTHLKMIWKKKKKPTYTVSDIRALNRKFERSILEAISLHAEKKTPQLPPPN